MAGHSSYDILQQHSAWCNSLNSFIDAKMCKLFKYIYILICLLYVKGQLLTLPGELYLYFICICIIFYICICICCAMGAFVGHRWQCVPPGGVVRHWLWEGGAATNQPEGLEFAKNLPKYFG